MCILMPSFEVSTTLNSGPSNPVTSIVDPRLNTIGPQYPDTCRKKRLKISFGVWIKIQWILHLFSQNPATNTENSAQSRSEHIFMELTLFVYNINSP